MTAASTFGVARILSYHSRLGCAEVNTPNSDEIKEKEEGQNNLVCQSGEPKFSTIEQTDINNINERCPLYQSFLPDYFASDDVKQKRERKCSIMYYILIITIFL